jgi:hypothetical protein
MQLTDPQPTWTTTQVPMVMIAKLKPIPLFSKIVLGSLLLMIAYGVTHRRNDRPAQFSNEAMTTVAGQQASYRQEIVGIARRVFQGTSIYDEEDGTQHELPTQLYYFRDRSDGRIVSSNIPDPPNDGRDYDPLAAEE